MANLQNISDTKVLKSTVINSNTNKQNNIKHTHTQKTVSPLKLAITSNYISKLIKLFNNSDKVIDKYLKLAPNKQHIFPQHNRIIVIGDIHGDLEVIVRCLILAKCIAKIEIPKNKTVIEMNKFFSKLKWIGNNTYIVQLGDQIDRVRPQNWDNNDITQDTAFEDEGSTLEIFYLFYRLNILSCKHGGRVFSIIGNHEIMNVDGDFRYVSKKEFQCFKDRLYTLYNSTNKTLKELHNNTKHLVHKNLTNLKNHNNNNSTKLPIGYHERKAAFSPSGLCANLMAMNYYTMLQIGDWLFCHGSPTLHVAKTFPIDIVNNIVSLYLLGFKNTNTNIMNRYYDEIMKIHPDLNNNETSILWARTFGEFIDTPSKEQHLHKLLNHILHEYNAKNNKVHNTTTLDTNVSHSSEQYNNSVSDNKNIAVKNIAIGHTPQFIQGINSICDNHVWRCDIGMSKAFLSSKNNRNTENNNKHGRENTHIQKTHTNSNVDFSHGDIQVLEIINGQPLILTE